MHSACLFSLSAYLPWAFFLCTNCIWLMFNPSTTVNISDVSRNCRCSSWSVSPSVSALTYGGRVEISFGSKHFRIISVQYWTLFLVFEFKVRLDIPTAPFGCVAGRHFGLSSNAFTNLKLFLQVNTRRHYRLMHERWQKESKTRNEEILPSIGHIAESNWSRGPIPR